MLKINNSYNHKIENYTTNSSQGHNLDVLGFFIHVSNETCPLIKLRHFYCLYGMMHLIKFITSDTFLTTK